MARAKCQQARLNDTQVKAFLHESGVESESLKGMPEAVSDSLPVCYDGNDKTLSASLRHSGYL